MFTPFNLIGVLINTLSFSSCKLPCDVSNFNGEVWHAQAKR